MTEELSFWSLIANASFIVQLVMLILLAASVVSWTVIFQRLQVYRKARQAIRDFENRFWSGMDLGQLFRECAGQPNPDSGEEQIFKAGFKEYTRLRQNAGVDPDAVMEGVQRAMRVAYSRETERLDRHLPFLATVGSASPYIGLFGTVWGIMHSFIALGGVKQATLAMVAPGIAEALFATGLGLLAAIPAVIFYNKLSADSDAIIAGYESFADEFATILSRQLDS